MNHIVLPSPLTFNRPLTVLSLPAAVPSTTYFVSRFQIVLKTILGQYVAVKYSESIHIINRTVPEYNS